MPVIFARVWVLVVEILSPCGNFAHLSFGVPCVVSQSVLRSQVSQITHPGLEARLDVQKWQVQIPLKKEPDNTLRNEPDVPVVIDPASSFCSTTSTTQPAAFLAGIGCVSTPTFVSCCSSHSKKGWANRCLACSADACADARADNCADADIQTPLGFETYYQHGTRPSHMQGRHNSHSAHANHRHLALSTKDGAAVFCGNDVRLPW